MCNGIAILLGVAVLIGFGWFARNFLEQYDLMKNQIAYAKDKRDAQADTSLEISNTGIDDIDDDDDIIEDTGLSDTIQMMKADIDKAEK
jgi:hypothetical protein